MNSFSFMDPRYCQIAVPTVVPLVDSVLTPDRLSNSFLGKTPKVPRQNEKKSGKPVIGPGGKEATF